MLDVEALRERLSRADASVWREFAALVIEVLAPSYLASAASTPESFPQPEFEELRAALVEGTGEAIRHVERAAALPAISLPTEPDGIGAFGVDAAAALYYAHKGLAESSVDDLIRAARRAADAAEFAGGDVLGHEVEAMLTNAVGPLADNEADDQLRSTAGLLGQRIAALGVA